jgi:electron transfer flavoprotein beta subunit
MKEKGGATEVVVVSIGGKPCEETLRTGLALGADKAILVQSDSVIEPLAAAKILAKLVQQEDANLVICGKQAIDDDANQTGQMLAGLLNWPQATFASKVEIAGSEAHVTREVDGGLLTLAVNLPCVITTDLRLNEPRYAKLPDIMKARSKPLATLAVADLGVDVSPRMKVLSVREPAQRSGGVKVPDVATLVDKLKNEAKVM